MRTLPSLLSAALVAGALALAVFYHGPQIQLLAGAQALLILWLVLALSRSYAEGVRLPNTSLALSLTLFWFWLAISLAWSAVPMVSTFNFWWVGSFAFVFWIYTVAPDRDRTWGIVTRFTLVGAVALSVMALVQLIVYGHPPRATFINIHSFAALLMLMVLPACGYLLVTLSRPAGRFRNVCLSLAIFLLFFTIAATRGRGTTISLLLGIAVLLLLTARHAPRRHLAWLIALCGVAYLSANLILHGAVADRLVSLTDPADAALPRWLIWRGSWQMALDNPWLGIGLGTYYLAWPPYRDPADSSLGFFAHNDYLQIWIETGLPGLVLLLAVLVSVLVMLFRMLRLSVPDLQLRTEVVGLFCGLLAVAVHASLDFNFYILPISIAAGLVLGRFHERATAVLPHGSILIHPRRFAQRHAYLTVVVLLALFPLSYLLALGASEHFFQRAMALAAHGQLQEADGAFSRAEVLSSSDDRVLLGHADLFRHSVRQLPPDARVDRETLYNDALRLLDRAERANPYRALLHSVRGRLYHENPDLAGPAWRELAAQAYGRALALNPRFFATRMAYAEMLLQTGREQDAKRLLEAGANHWYYPDRSLIAYFELTATLHREAGELDEAQRLRARVADIRTELMRLAPARPVVRDPELTLPLNKSYSLGPLAR